MKQKKTLLVLGTMVVLSLAACNSSADNMLEGSQITEEVSVEVAEDSSAVETGIAESTEVSSVVEEESVESTEEVKKIERNYWWYLDGITIAVSANGAPDMADSDIYFWVIDSAYDYKIFTDVTVYARDGVASVNKDTDPERVDALNGGDGIFGFVNDFIGFYVGEEEVDGDEDKERNTEIEEGIWKCVFSYWGGSDSLSGEYSLIWNADGKLTTEDGYLEQSYTSFRSE